MCTRESAVVIRPVFSKRHRWLWFATIAVVLGYAGAGGFFYLGMFAYTAGTPFAYITYHHVPAQYHDLVFAISIVGNMVANFVNGRIATRLGSERLVVRGAAAGAAAGLVTAMAAWTDCGGLWGLAVPLFVFLSTIGFIVGNSIVGALARFPGRTGAVSALVGALHYGSGIVVSRPASRMEPPAEPGLRSATRPESPDLSQSGDLMRPARMAG